MYKNFPKPEEYSEYNELYVKDLHDLSLRKALRLKEKVTKRILHGVPKQKWDFAYADGKWTVKEVLQHIIDSERVFMYRALHVLRNDPNSYFSFDENAYADEAKNINRSSKSLLKEYIALTKSTYHFFENLEEKQLQKSGELIGKKATIRALGYILSGHAIHHCKVIKERYL